VKEREVNITKAYIRNCENFRRILDCVALVLSTVLRCQHLTQSALSNIVETGLRYGSEMLIGNFNQQDHKCNVYYQQATDCNLVGLQKRRRRVPRKMK
jgi:hypothetical protein